MGITIRIANERFGAYAALDDVSVGVPAGSPTALLGPAGAGMPTLLRIVAGLASPDAGSVVIGGHDATNLPPPARDVGFVFVQHYAAVKHVTVRDDVGFGLRIRTRPKGETGRRVGGRLALVGTTDGLAERYPARPCGGRRQRMARARVEQVGAPSDRADRPASDCVLGFVGRVNRPLAECIRPHEVRLRDQREPDGDPAVVERLPALGFETRVELRRLRDGRRL